MKTDCIVWFNVLITLIGIDVLLILTLWRQKRRKVSIFEKIIGTLGLSFFLWLMIMLMISVVFLPEQN